MTAHPSDCFCYECRGDFENTGDARPPPEPEFYSIDGICQEVKDQIRKITEGVKDMINRTSTSENGGARGRRSRSDSLVPYLKAEHVAHEQTEAKIIAARVEADTFKPGTDAVVLKLHYRGTNFLWTLRMNNPNLDVLCDALGNDETKWTNEAITLYTETDDFNGKVWIRVAVPSKAKRGK